MKATAAILILISLYAFTGCSGNRLEEKGFAVGAANEKQEKDKGDGISKDSSNLMTSSVKVVRCDSVYRHTDEDPAFRKSFEAFLKHLQKNLVLKAECKGEGSFVMRWTVDKEGNMIDIDTPVFGQTCREDALRQLKDFPRWTPAKSKGTPVCVSMYLCLKLAW